MSNFDWTSNYGGFGASTNSGGNASKKSGLGSDDWMSYNSSGTQNSSASTTYDPWASFGSDIGAKAPAEPVDVPSDWANYKNSITQNTSTNNSNLFGSDRAYLNSSALIGDAYDPFARSNFLVNPVGKPRKTQSRAFYPISHDDTAEDLAMVEDPNSRGTLNAPFSNAYDPFAGFGKKFIETPSRKFQPIGSDDTAEDMAMDKKDDTSRCYYSGCRAKFPNEENLRQHVVNVHVEKDYLCGYCDKEFVHSQELKCHLDRNHPYSGANPLLRRRW